MLNKEKRPTFILTLKTVGPLSQLTWPRCTKGEGRGALRCGEGTRCPFSNEVRVIGTRQRRIRVFGGCHGASTLYQLGKVAKRYIEEKEEREVDGEEGRRGPCPTREQGRQAVDCSRYRFKGRGKNWV